MTKTEIIEKLAKARVVERMVRDICKSTAPEMNDLSQMVYLALLDKPDETIIGAHDEGWLEYLIIRIIKNNYFHHHSGFGDLYRKFARKTTNLEDYLARTEDGQDS